MALVPDNRKKGEGIKPEVQSYEINGRIFDKQTSTFIEGVEISLLGGDSNSVKTDNQGKFKIKVNLPTYPENGNVVDTQSQLIINKSGYTPTFVPIITLSKKVKTTLSNTGLVNIEKSIENEINSIKASIQDKTSDIKRILGTSFGQIKQKAMMKIVNIIITKLIPLILGLLAVFGISKLSQINQKQCPGTDELKGAVKKRNSIVKQLNNIFAQIAANTALIAVIKVLQTQFELVVTSTLTIPFPTPPIVNEIIDKAQEQVKELKKSDKQVLIALVYLIAALAFVTNLLKGVDELIQECAEDELDQTELDQELLNLIKEQSTQNTGYNNIEVNGFTLSVQVDDQEIGSLKKRFAVAKDAGGVIVLKGEKSLASSDQILIDELAYYIRVNDLKAV